MFEKRYDGRRIHKTDPFNLIIPYIMKTRTDSMNMFDTDIPCAPMDEYIKLKRAEGKDYNYMKILLASIVRVIAERPALNRFVMNGRIYTRNKIWISFVVHKTLRDDSAGTTVKLEFDGTESIADISAAIDKIIEENAHVGANSETDNLVNVIMAIPGFLIRWVVNFLMALDKINLLPKAVINASPFHTSLFVTNMKSLGIGRIYHHVYEFGTTGLFVAIGKEENKVVANHKGEIEAAKLLPLGVVMDERFCDGLYFARSIKLLKKYMSNPELLEKRLDKKVEDVE